MPKKSKITAVPVEQPTEQPASEEAEPKADAQEMTDVLNDKQRETILTKVPAARLGTPEDIAAAAVYLSSNEAGYVTGQTILVDGGAYKGL